MKEWLVTVSLPIEAETAEEAVREYWRYVTELGAAELPAFVSPVNNELAMSAYTDEGPAPYDPEED